MIEQLTPVQESRLPEFCDKWLKIGLCTDPADRQEAERGIAEAYEIAGRDVPRIVWCTSPLAMCLTRVAIKNLANDKASVGDSVYGQHEAAWLGFYDYFHDACGLTSQTAKLQGLWRAAKAAGWWLPHEHICWVSERHSACLLEDGVIHCETGPAVAYPDGFAVWAIGGVRVDEQIVMRPETQTLEQLRSEQNEEVKRVRIDRYGWDKYLVETGAKVLDTQHHDWMESLMRTSDGMNVLCTYDPSTGRPYALEVDPSCETCEQAQRYLMAPETALDGVGVQLNSVYPVIRT